VTGRSPESGPADENDSSEDREDRRNKRTTRATLLAAGIAACITASAMLIAALINANAKAGEAKPPKLTPSPSSPATQASHPPNASGASGTQSTAPWCMSNSNPVLNLKAATVYCQAPADTQIDFKVALGYVGSMRIEKDGDGYKNLDLCKIFKNVLADNGPAIEYYSGGRKISEFRITVGSAAKESCT